MYCKVFINSTCLLFSEQEERGFILAPDFKGQNDFFDWVNQVYHLETKGCFQFKKDAEKCFETFQSIHQIIIAAGGLVIDDQERLLVIKRLNKWDLPKGKVEENENIKEAAVREVAEECGLKDVSIIGTLPDSWHCYTLKGHRILKRTYWFEMKSNEPSDLIPQVEEDITEVDFMNVSEVKKAKENTYQSLVPLFDSYLSRYE